MTHETPERHTVGRHLVADLCGVESELLRGGDRLIDALEDALRTAGFELLHTSRHDFPGGGFTAITLLSESHAAIHTYPELGYLALDVFSCGDADPRAILAAISRLVRPAQIREQVLRRQALVQRETHPAVQ